MKALVVIDVQEGMFAYPDFQPHDGGGVVARIGALIARARAAGTPIFYVQHDGGPGDDLEAGKPGFAYRAAIAPGPDDEVPDDEVTVKTHGSAFKATDFDTKLKRAGIDHIVVCGMQSEYCIDAAIRGAVERHYTVTLVADGHSTFDNKVLKAPQIIAHQNETLNGSYATVLPAAEISFEA